MAGARVLYDIIARDNASRTFLRVGEAATSMERRTSKVGAAIGAGLKVGTLAAGALAVASTHAATEFQSAMTRISTQAGGSAKDVKVLGDQVLKLGGKVQQAPQQLAEALYHLKSVGMDNVDAMKALRTASDLAAVGGSDLESTTNALAGAWRTGIKGATSFGQAAATVNSIIGAGNMTMEQFTEALSSGILPTAKTFGLSLQQVGAALALFTDEGVPAADAATRLRMSISLLGAPSGAAEKQLKKIHLTGLQLANAMRGRDGIIGAIQLLKDHLDASGMSAAQQSQILSRAFGGGRSSAGILSMISNLDVLKKKQDQVNKSTGRYADAVKMQRQTAEAQWKRLTTGFESMSIRLGVVLLPPVTRFVGFLNDKAIPAAGRLGRALGSLIPVAKIKSAVGDVKSVIGGFLSQLSGKDGIGGFLSGLTGKASPKPKAWFDKFPTTVGGTDLTGAPHLGSGQTSSRGSGAPLQQQPHYGVGQVAPSGGVKGPALAPEPHGGSGMVAPLVARKTAAPPKTAAQKLGETIRKAVSGGIEAVDWSKLGSSLGKGLGSMFEWIAAHGAELSKKLGVALAKIDWVNVGKQLGGVALPFAIGFIDNLMEPLFHKDFWTKHWLDTILAVISIVPIGKVLGTTGKLLSKVPWGKLGEVLDRVPWGKLLPFGEKLAAAIGPIVLKINEFVGKLALKFVEAMARRFPRISAWFARELSLLPLRLGVLGLDLAEKGGRAIAKLGEALVKHVPGMGNKFIRFTLKVFGRFTLYQVGVNIAKSLINGAWAQLKNIGSWMQKHLVDPVVHWVESGFGIASPSKVFTSIGGNLIAGLKNGVVDAAKGIGGWIVSHVVSPVTSPFSGAGSWLPGKGSSLVSGFKGGVSNAAKGIGGWTTSHVITPARAVFNSSGTMLRSAGSSLISGLRSGISSAMRGMASWVKGTVVDPIVSAVKHFFGIKSPSRVFMGIGGHLVSGLVKGMAQTNGADIARRIFGDMPSALGSIVSKGLISLTGLPGKAMKALGSLGSKLGGLFGKLFGGGGGGGSVSRWSGDVATVLAMLGAPPTALPAVLRRIEIESGGNPNAINLTDSNARAGHPSQGLMQTIPSTFAAYAGPFASRGITDPLASIYAGVNYAMHRYGSNWISVMTRPGGYAKGTGGAARGLAWVGEQGPELVNFKGGEDVLSHPQSMAFAKTHGIRLPGYASGTINNAADRVARDRAKVRQAKDDLSRAERHRKGVAAAEKRLKAAEKELQAAEIALSNAKRSAKTSIANAIATGLQKTLGTGTASAIASAIKSLATKLLNAGYSGTAASIQKKGSKLESLANKKASIAAQIAAANKYASDQAGNITDFLSISGTSAMDVGSLISQMTGQQKTASGFVSLTKSLKARGASKALLQQLSDAGPGSQLATILGARNVTTGDIGKLNKLMSSGSKLATGFGRDMADLMYDSGKDASKGFLAGLKSQEKALGKQMAKLAADLVKAIKKALKIKSPSQVFRDEVGKQVALGMVVGMDAHRPHIAAAAHRMAITARKAAVLPSAPGRQSAAFDRLATLLASGQAGGTEVHVHFDDARLRDLIDVQVKPKIRASEERQAYRAKVGRRG